jgi:predicted short-subunit dehydrogenase-like oxidoreductase (DUF2520 family)
MITMDNDNSHVKIGFIGAGKTCRNLALNLHALKFNVHGIHSLNKSSSQNICNLISQQCIPYQTPQDLANDCDLVFITTPDDSIQTIAKSIKWHRNMGVVHCSGAGTSFWLNKAKLDGASIASYHPMQTFSNDNANLTLEKVFFAIEGDSSLTAYLKNITTQLGGFSISIKAEHKLLYHASAFMVCGLITTIIGKAVDPWKTIGYSEEQALDILTPLIERTIHNVSTNGIIDSLTGPISRGDVGTIKDHIDSLRKHHPSLLPIYCQLSLENVLLEQKRKITKPLREISVLLKSTMNDLDKKSVV